MHTIFPIQLALQHEQGIDKGEGSQEKVSTSRKKPFSINILMKRKGLWPLPHPSSKQKTIGSHHIQKQKNKKQRFATTWRDLSKGYMYMYKDYVSFKFKFIKYQAWCIFYYKILLQRQLALYGRTLTQNKYSVKSYQQPYVRLAKWMVYCRV